MSKDSFSKKAPTFVGVYRFIPAVFITLGSALLFIAGQFIGILLFSIVLSLFGMSPEEITKSLDDSAATKLMATLFIESISVGLVFGLLRYTGYNPLKFLKLNKKPNAKTFQNVAAAYGLYFLSFVAVSTIGALLVNGLDVNQQQQLGYTTVAGFDYLVVFITLVVLPPIAEEILFRGFMYQNLKSVINVRVAAVITSALFAVAHLEFFGNNSLNWIAAIDTFVLSLFLIWLLNKTNNLWAPILLHALKNLIAFVALFVI